ncbi:MAG: hypothetical protein MUC38_01170 [Cyclobacteriaceae bacterium]|jgi:hypothetical protein|nr:hypothetical protein [Cyclobacteriaceae bacterium]
MELRDLIVTPLLLIVLLVAAFIVRPFVTDAVNRKYFYPALAVKILGALALGFLYQFYYSGGDTFNYHTFGSRIIWEAFTDDFSKGLRLLFHAPGSDPDLYSYHSRILFYHDPQSFFVVRVAAFFDLLTFSTYSATAVLFALFSFVGSWALFLTFYKEFPLLHRWIATATLFIPSVFFWGSGILKDTMTLGALGLLTFAIHRLLIKKKVNTRLLLVFGLSVYLIYHIKQYILLCYLPAALFWVYSKYFFAIRSRMLKAILVPVFAIVCLASIYVGLAQVSEGGSKYSLQNLARTARITAYDIRYYSGRDAGSGYSLGELDGSFASMLKLAPSGVNVSLFRPYLWEVRNPLMLLSALESLFFLLFTLFLFFRGPLSFFRAFSNPHVVFCFAFSITFAFGVGVSTFNFGTLTRYKIPLLPFYLVGLVLIYYLSNKERNRSVFETTE